MSQKNNRIIKLAVLVSLVFVAALYFTINKKIDELSKTYYYLGTVSEVKVFNAKKSNAEAALKDADTILKDIHNKMSAQQSNTEINKINEKAGISPVTVSNETFNVIEASIKYANLTGGVFDPTIGAISSLWQIGTNNARVPSSDEITRNLQLINYKNIELDKSKKTVFLNEKNMRLDLGAIAKGYVADLICENLTSNNIESAIINLGGNVFVLGDKSGQPYKIGIQAPYEEASTSIGYIKAENTSVVTSGIYERFVKAGDKLYHHMLNPKTGYPFENNLNSVTIISKKSIDGDALSTSTFGMGLEKGLEFINSKKDVGAIFLTKDKKIYLSNSMKSRFILTDESYKIVE
ncbi:FAD:protein FMN transferase [Peptostreptococcus sp. D1]|uniref:FAD:protein FMN transferase n=1 Tax=Peptostreptococcus sp. D1 TaxID=72304 RepID=UPI0008EB966E|nr:FAD:protein FMN transferase [Peptostreptococcus sp. D1]SFE23961.1 thiamine biosynthesis lipoprotein [Peptostreptococcus sp. D1]